MRWIDRGPAPKRVAGYARKHTHGWVISVEDGEPRPPRAFWGRFRPALGKRSGGMCWYCERRCGSATEVGGRAATLDHFKPISRFPKLSYDWSNWVFSCIRCNRDNKGNKWPDNGYVDPAAGDVHERPERYFSYDTLTHHIIPSNDLTESEHQRAQDTIRDLGLNEVDVLSSRQDWMQRFIEDVQCFPVEERLAMAEYLESQSHEYLGAMRMALSQMGEGDEMPESA